MKLRVLAACLLFAGSAAADTPRNAEAVLRAAPERATQTVIDGRLWRCFGTGCRAQAATTPTSQSVARECRRVAAEFGELMHYRSGKRVLTPSDLTACNTAAAKRPTDAALAAGPR